MYSIHAVCDRIEKVAVDKAILIYNLIIIFLRYFARDKTFLKSSCFLPGKYLQEI